MSGSCPRSSRAGTSARGFTLLELLIVLALVAMMAAMVVPRLQGTYDAIVRSGDRSEAIRQIERMPLRVRADGHAIEIPANDPAAFAAHVDLPGGWTARALQPLRIEASGLCHPAVVRVDGGGGSDTWALSAPDCGIADAP